MSLLGFGSRSLIPDELIEGYGYDPVEDTWLIRPAIPLAGAVQDDGTPDWPNAWQTKAIVSAEFLLFWPFLKAQERRALIWQSAYDAIINGIGRVGETPRPNPNFVFKWRPRGSADATPWTEISGEYLGISLNSREGVTSGTREIIAVSFEDRRLNPSDPDFDAGTTALPAHDSEIEFFLLGPIAPDEHHPIIVDGLTDGEFTANVYAGLYSARDADGAVVPTGIRYDETAVLAMTNPVRFLITAPIEDARDWLEKHIYGANGYAPRLDEFGRVSPVSRTVPVDTSGLSLISNLDTQPGPDWTAGQRIYNLIRFKYRRYFVPLVLDPDTGDYVPASPDAPPRFAGVTRQSELEWVTITITWKDPDSILRHGEQPLEIDGLAYGAIGKVPPDELSTPPAPSTFGEFIQYVRELRRLNRTDQIVVPRTYHAVPLTGNIQDETGWQLAYAANVEVLARYANGAPIWRLPVMRSAIRNERVGDYVNVNLSWMPDYETGRRGLIGLAQIVGLGDLDCAWRRPTLELVVPAGS